MAAGLGWADDAADLLAATGNTRDGAGRAGFGPAAAGFAATGRAGRASAVRGGLGAACFAAFAAGRFAALVLDAADEREGETVFAVLRAALGEGFEATFFTSTSAARDPVPAREARWRARRGIPSRAGGRGARPLGRLRDALSALSHVRRGRARAQAPTAMEDPDRELTGCRTGGTTEARQEPAPFSPFASFRQTGPSTS